MNITATLNPYNDADQPSPLRVSADPDDYKGVSIVALQVGSEVIEVDIEELNAALIRVGGYCGGER